MLSDEEKKAIEKIRSFNQYNWEMNNLKEKEFAKPYFDALDTILNLIKKQQKEIEELKDEYNTKLLSNAGIYQLGFKDGENSNENKININLKGNEKNGK